MIANPSKPICSLPSHRKQGEGEGERSAKSKDHCQYLQSRVREGSQSANIGLSVVNEPKRTIVTQPVNVQFSRQFAPLAAFNGAA